MKLIVPTVRYIVSDPLTVMVAVVMSLYVMGGLIGLGLGAKL